MRPETGSVCVADSVCEPSDRLSENDQVPFAATVTVYVVCESTVRVILSPATPVPVTGTEEVLLDGTVIPGAAGGAYTVTLTLPLTALVKCDAGSVCVAESVWLPTASVTVIDQLPDEHDVVAIAVPWS